MRKLLLATVLTIGFALPNLLWTSCGLDDCDCSDIPRFFQASGLRSIEHILADERTVTRRLDSLERIPFAQYVAAEISLEVVYLAWAQPSWKPNFSLMSSALACSCADPGSSGAKDQYFENIEIFTVHDFDAETPAGTTIRDRFIDENQSFEPGRIRNSIIRLRLQEAPTASDTFQFRVVAQLSRGVQIDALSSPLVFIP